MRRPSTKLIALALPLALLGAAAAQQPSAPAPDPSEIEFFEKTVRPILAENCLGCHNNANKPMGGLALDSRAGLLKGGDLGAVVVPGQPEKSLLVSAVRYHDPKLQMPPKGKLSDDKIAVLAEWVKQGAPWPEVKKLPAIGAAKSGFDLDARRARHWAWQPVRMPSPPTVRGKSWVRSPIDAFILKKLEAAGLTPAKPADRRTLIRRATCDLIGLPPTPTEVDAFVNDKSPNAWEKVVDRLLDSPHYGERWARHWMDLVRYAETDGHEFDFEKPGAFEYRDYLIRALNADVPYDQLVREHIAGDLLPNPRMNPAEGFNESLIGTGFYWLGEGKHSPVDLRVDEAERVDNQIDVTSKAFLGLSLGCARCHDHKFDAISARDYYALSGYLHSSRYDVANITPADKIKPVLAELTRVNAEIEASASVGTLAPAALSPAPKPSPADPEAFEEFSGRDWNGWFVTGQAFGSGPRPTALYAAMEKETPRVSVLNGTGVADSGALADNLTGTLRSKTFLLEKPYVHIRMAGRASTASLIIDGFQRIQYPIYGGLRLSPLSPAQFRWHTMDVTKWVGHRAYLDFVDPGPGRIIVDRVVLSDQPAPTESAQATDATLQLASVGQSDHLKELLERRRALEQKLPAPRVVMAIADGTGENDHIHIRGNPNALGAEVPRRFLEAISGANQGGRGEGSGRLDLARRMTSSSNPLFARVMVNRIWKHHFGEGIVRTPDDFGVMGQEPTHPELLDWLATQFMNPTSDSHAKTQRRKEGQEQLTTETQRHRVVYASLEVTSRKAGKGAKNQAQAEARTFPPYKGGTEGGAVSTAGTRPPAPNNGGDLSRQAPTPEHLNTERRPWSMKRIHRLILLSNAYQMASTPDGEADQLDPLNKLVHRMPVRRLEAEAVRDAVLAVSGRLDRKMFGPSVMPVLTAFMEGRGRPDRSGPLDGDGRRSIYIGVRRNFLVPMFLAFDYPVPFNCMGRRSVSNVPAQALTMMNNPFVVQQAEVWAKRVLAEKGTAEERVRKMYETAFGRPPEPGELAEALAFVRARDKAAGQTDTLRSWSDLCHVLMNVKEFIFIN